MEKWCGSLRSQVFNKSYLEQNSSCFSPSPLAQTNLVQGRNPEVFLHCVASHPWTSPNSRPSSFMGVNCSAELRPALIWNWVPWSHILSMPICSGDLDSLLCFILSGSSAFSPLVYCSAGSRPIGVYTWCSIGSKAVASSHHVCSLAKKGTSESSETPHQLSRPPLLGLTRWSGTACSPLQRLLRVLHQLLPCCKSSSLSHSLLSKAYVSFL